MANADPNLTSSNYIDYLKAQWGVTGTAFFVNNASVKPNGGTSAADNSNYGRDPLTPYNTIDYAIGTCTASRGDAIFVLGGHSETVTASVTMDVAGVQIIGLPWGNKKPRITVNGAIDAVTITAANCALRNIEFAIVTTDAATAFVNIAAANAWLDGLYASDCSAAAGINVVDVITIASGANDLRITNCEFRNTTTAVNSFVSIEAAVSGLIMIDDFFFGACATAGIIDGATATQIHMKRVTVGTVGTTIPAATLDNNPTGAVEDSVFLGTHTTLATNFNPGNALRLKSVWVLEETDASRQATNIVPALDVD